ncbi:hypothetical protein ACVWYH_005508 [Bradyrhizobium sp. GM24.11]
MVRNFYQLRIGKYAGALIQRSRFERQEILWLQLNLMRLGNELARVEYCRRGRASQSDMQEMRLRQRRHANCVRMIASARPEAARRDARRFEMTV